MARIREIVIDAVRPSALVRFWAAAVDGFSVRSYDASEVARLAAMGRTRCVLSFERSFFRPVLE